MRRPRGSDHLAYSFTDLMTSLMIIFVLLLVAFLNNQASASHVATQKVLSDLTQQLTDSRKLEIAKDPKDPNTVMVSLPGDLLTFETNRYNLKPEGENFLKARIPELARTLCGGYRSHIESVVVEGHSDQLRYAGTTPEESQNLNLKLSQDRSMEVAKKSLEALSDDPATRECLMERLSATGRGEQDPKETNELSRRVVFKIRVNSASAAALLR
jgi:flagellar motor protein MotB